MRQTERFLQKGEEDRMFLLRKALHGLLHSSREWNRHLHKLRTGVGCEQSVPDLAVNLWKGGGRLIIFIVYVDDILLYYKLDSAAAEIIQHFEKKFEVRVDEQLWKFLGFSVEYSGRCVKPHNTPMIRRILDFSRIKDCTAAIMPLKSGLDLSTNTRELIGDSTFYRQLVGTREQFMARKASTSLGA